MQYDPNNNLITTVTPRGTSFSSAYDPLDRLVKSTDPLNASEQFKYDAQDNITHVRDARGVSTQYHFDGLGNLTQLDSPDTGSSKYKYDAAGNITEITDARGVVTSFTYDALNRLITRRYPANPTLDTRFHYDSITAGNRGIGRLTAVEDMTGVLNYSYDAHGNLIAQQHTPPTNDVAQAEQIGYGYDSANQLHRIDYPAGFSIHYLRNAAGQVNQVEIQHGTDKPIAFAQHLTYLPFGPLKSLTWNNGTTLQRTYDLDYRLTAQTVAGWSDAYTYDAIGNVTKVQSSSLGDLNYSYDALDRLTEETNAIRQQTFTYDAVGNRTNKTLTPLVEGKVQDSSIMTYQYGASNNRLIQIDDHLVSSDGTGNLIKDHYNRQFSYDEQNRLSSVEIDGMIRAQFRYNALGQRTQKITPQGVTTFLYGPDGQLLGETMFSSEGKKLVSQFYFWLDGLPLGGVSINYDVAGVISNSMPFYIHSDHVNTPRIVVNAVQEIVWEWKSDAFGLEKASGSLTLNLRFPGQYYDAETGLHYNYFRNYDPETGRYLESDPIGLKGGFNTYGYATSNPLKYIDPFGLESVFEWSSKAEDIAEKSGLPGTHNGPRDAFRHCVASCMIASSNWGESTSRFAGWAHEVSNFGQSKDERAMDDWNNQVGLCAAKDKKSPDDCPRACMTLLENNVLIKEATSNGAYY
ncbi:RHS repeat domain-containing protein [Pseudomonas sp. LB3P93]